MKIKIYIAMHKKAIFPQNKIYIPIQVGAEGKKHITKITDDTKKNISHKNPNYCELTGTYWIWQNDKSDIVGLTHYRRYFFKEKAKTLNDVIDEKNITNILKNYDIIVPPKTYFIRYKNMKKAYKKLHNEKDLIECRNIITEKYQEYTITFDEVMNSKSFYAYNMFITHKYLFDSYYEWLFNILFELENRIDISSYDDYNKRIYGFLSERLFNVWLKHNNLKVKEVIVYNSEKNYKIQYLKIKLTNLLFKRKR